jgi:hypothetical protein
VNNATRTNETNKISNFVQAAIYLVFILAIVAIVVGVSAFVENQDTDIAVFLLAIGFISMALAGYILLQSRKRTADLKIATPPIITTIECKKCGIKTTREFQRGDYVYKELEKCEKCEDKKTITAIYREVKEKEKDKTSNL